MIELEKVPITLAFHSVKAFKKLLRFQGVGEHTTMEWKPYCLTNTDSLAGEVLCKWKLIVSRVWGGTATGEKDPCGREEN